MVLVLVACVCLDPLGAFSAGWEVITSEDGLCAGDWVDCILADSAGNVWLGVHYNGESPPGCEGWGLCRFDGVGFEHLAGGIAPKNVRGIAEGQDGCIYAIGGGPLLMASLCRFDGTEWNRVLHPSGDIGVCVADGRDGSIWYGFMWSGIGRYWPGESRWSEVWSEGPVGSFTTANLGDLIVRRDGTAWFMGCMGPKYEVWTIAVDGEGHVLGEWRGWYGVALAEDASGRLWAGGGGLWVFDEDARVFREVRIPGVEADERCVWDIAAREDGSGLAVCGPFGVGLLTQEGWQVYREGCDFPAGGATAVAIDRAGNIWASVRGGVALLPARLPVLEALHISVDADKPRYAPGEELVLTVSCEALFRATVDFYIAVETPDGALAFLPGLGCSARPALRGLFFREADGLRGYELLRLRLVDLRPGKYRFHAACTCAGKSTLASNIASCEWEFEK